MITVECRMGRVIEVCFSATLTPVEMKDMRTPLSAAVVRVGVDVIFAVDFRPCGPLDPDVLPMMLGLMRSDNRKILRSVHLFDASTVIAEQMKTAIAEAANPQRRAFFDLPALEKWLSGAATADEMAAVHNFFSRG
jgi:hypothetical protein